MDAVSSVKEMYTAIVHMRTELQALISSLTPEEKTRRGSLAQWSAKDTLAHLVFWENYINTVLEKGLQGEKTPLVGDYPNQLNDGVFIEHIDQPFEEAAAQEAAVYQHLLNILKPISPDDLVDPDKYAFLDGRSILDRTIVDYVYHAGNHIGDYYLKNGQLAKSRTLQESMAEHLYVFPCWEGNAHYNLARFYSLNNFPAEAIGQLRSAIKIKPDLIEWAKQDSDLDPLREMAEFQALFK